MDAPFACLELSFAILLVCNFHNIEFLQLVVVRYHADTTDALVGVITLALLHPFNRKTHFKHFN